MVASVKKIKKIIKTKNFRKKEITVSLLQKMCLVFSQFLGNFY